MTQTTWKPEVEVDGKFYQNGQTFATREEAEASARNRFFNWTLCTAHRAVEVDGDANPVTYRWDPEVGDVPIK